ncbi:MAG: DUF3072 domain-containing protein [Chitinophagaceae bacterium]
MENNNDKQHKQQVNHFNEGYLPGTKNSPANTDNTESTTTGPGSNAVKDPDDWTTGDEPMTGAQASYLRTLSTEAGEEFDDSLSKAEASKRINELQQKTGRGLEK